MNAYDVFKEIAALIDQVLKENPNQVDKYKKGKEQLLGFFCRPGHEGNKGKGKLQNGQ